MLTEKRLDKFIATRNKSSFNNNLQFSIDADECGFDVNELGEPKKVSDYEYHWNTPFGTLIEKNCKLHLVK
jgi:hypothetical protein